MRTEEVIPSAARLTNSLRDLGYEFTNAVADLVDNSISHGAKRVAITIHFHGPDSWIRVADDGDGMSGTRISEAMRLGSAGDYDSEDLGKFGLGLKTASLSQCRVLTVASRTDPNRRSIEVRRLDLDHVTQTDRWSIIHLAGAERPEPLIEPLQNGTGTVVMWEKLDRVLSYDDPWGTWVQKHLLGLAEELELHLAMVFGRFLSGRARRRGKFQITINGETVEAWDPFVEQEPKTEALPQQDFRIEHGLVRFRPFVLPPQREFSSDAAWRRASGPKNWNRQQGFYVYRADRMILSGGWARMRTQDEHTKLARAALEFWPDLDDAFEINISKMRVRLPGALKEHLERPVGELVKRSQERYRGGERSGAGRAGGGRPRSGTGPTNAGSGMAAAGGRTSGNGSGTGRPAGTGGGAGATATAGGAGASGATTATTAPAGSRATPAAALERAAKRAGAAEALDLIRAELVRSDPEVARELGW